MSTAAAAALAEPGALAMMWRRMTSPAPAIDGQDTDPGSLYWRRNLVVCIFGSFTTIVAMTLLLPFLPLYVEELGVSDGAAIVQWSGIAFGATFFSAALVAPLWGRLADRYGRKLMLIRASLGMAVAMSLIGMAQDVYQLVGLRLLAGLLGGYASGSYVLVATQTPNARTGWALGTLSSGIMAGNLAGPLLGGFLPPLIGIRSTFLGAGAVIFVSFLATTFLIREERRPRPELTAKARVGFAAVPDKGPLLAMLFTGMLLMFANMSIEPIIRAGHWNVIIGCLAVSSVLLIPQAFVTAGWQLIGLRFLMGLALGGLLPCVASVIRHSVPDRVAGTMLGYSTSSQYAGQVAGPLLGGFVGGHAGMRTVFLGTALLMAAGALYDRAVRPKL